MKIRKLLIANRGEIACRVIRTARELGIATVAVHSDADTNALHVSAADESVRIGPAAAADSYLDIDAIVAAAASTGADAVHPGYGFLSENPDFVEALADANVSFVGPSAKAIRAMGLKDRAKQLMHDASVPVVPGYHGEQRDPDFLSAKAAEIGYPLLIKARAGGGGKGMRLVSDPDDFADALQSAEREAEASFGDSACILERYVAAPRHIEIQILADQHDNIIYLFERDCSLQRRHQKVIEEAPAPGLPEEVRRAMGDAAVAAARAVGYVGAGTVEFIVDGSSDLTADSFFFMEMNTRLQVEHAITECITGVDLVAQQIAVAEGRKLSVTQSDLAIDGHAFEARLYAEDATAGFLPAVGRLEHLSFGSGAGVRIDTGVRQGDDITPYYDPMVAKVIAHGPDRGTALSRLEQALRDTLIVGTTTNRAFLARLAADQDVVRGTYDTGLIGHRGATLTADPAPHTLDHLAAALFRSTGEAQPLPTYDGLANFRLYGNARRRFQFGNDAPIEIGLERVAETTWRAELPSGPIIVTDLVRADSTLTFVADGDPVTTNCIPLGDVVHVHRDGITTAIAPYRPGQQDDATSNRVVAPMPGRIVRLLTQPGDTLEKGQKLLVLEAMKMEHALTATHSATVAEVLVTVGDQVDQGTELLRFDEEAS